MQPSALLRKLSYPCGALSSASWWVANSRTPTRVAVVADDREQVIDPASRVAVIVPTAHTAHTADHSVAASALAIPGLRGREYLAAGGEAGGSRVADVGLANWPAADSAAGR
jgi:hypothetical protein